MCMSYAVAHCLLAPLARLEATGLKLQADNLQGFPQAPTMACALHPEAAASKLVGPTHLERTSAYARKHLHALLQLCCRSSSMQQAEMC